MASPFSVLVLCCVFRLSCCVTPPQWFNNISTNLFNLRGDIMLGGLFPINLRTSDYTHKTESNSISCVSLNEYGLGMAIVMKYAIEEINANKSFLPGIKLGFEIYNTCLQSAVVIKPTISFLTAKSNKVLSVECNYTDFETSVSAVIGPYSSEMVSVIGKLLGFFLMPQISYGATSDKFSDEVLYPSFFRTVPTDKWQVYTMALLMKEFNWTWVAVVGSKEEYGQQGVQEFSKVAETMSVCVAYRGLIPVYTEPEPAITVILNSIVKTKVNVIVVFSLSHVAEVFFKEVIKRNLTGVWVASESWAISSRVTSLPNIHTIGTVVGLTTKTQTLDLLTPYTVELFRRLSEERTKTPTPAPDSDHPDSPCPQCSNLSPANISIMEGTRVQRSAFSVYAAIYSVAQALHNMLDCDSTTCKWDRKNKIYPWKLSQVLKNTSIDLGGTHLEFDRYGNPSIGYDVIEWIWNGTNVNFTEVGSFSGSLSINKSLFKWHTENSQVPVSTCSAECDPGQVQRVKGFHSCCFDCINCTAGTYHARKEDRQCTDCPKGQWSLERSTKCTDPTYDVLSWDKPESLEMILAGVVLLICQGSVGVLFFKHRGTPLVCASGGSLSFVALVSLMGACLSLLFFLGQPGDVVCRLQLPFTSIFQTVTLSIITFISVQIFLVTEFPQKTASHLQTLRGPGSWLFVLACCGVQAGIIGWFVQEVPSLSEYKAEMEINFVRTFLTCPVEPLTGFALMQGFNGVMALVSFMCTFMAIKPVHQYNLARDITFCSLIFCVFWVTFIPIYIGLKDKRLESVVYVSFSLSSNLGLVAAYYFPKCYLILRKPELNTENYFCTFLEGVPPTPPEKEPQPQTASKQSKRK
ncbi:taste receptor type 1 member 3-like [Sphaeramia orbicularis]|uniref:taste receptor type 1 member 3-like n=1 Tax=Sphaeramia orbicularis TaxID=375764 RepID=UPI00117F5564|nr:taste receptor type 1 member 3-like [Sphaeramia orbicularis]